MKLIFLVLFERISNQQLVQKQYENKMNENALLNDLHGWRDVISNTLNVIEKVSSDILFSNRKYINPNGKGKVLDQISRCIKIYQNNIIENFFFKPSYLPGVTLKVTSSITFFLRKKFK